MHTAPMSPRSRVRPRRFAGFPLWGAALAALCVLAGGFPSGETAEPARPNILFILADDLGWADVGYHGSKIATPHLDRLAREGVRLERHYVAPTCTPTRVGLITGRYPSRFGVLAPAYGKIFNDGTVTLASELRDAGYRTSICGKWHMGSPPECVPRQHGFVSSYGYFHGQIDPYTHLYKTGVRSWHRDDEYLEEEGHATDLITAEAIRTIEARGEAPFFLYVAYSVPHFPLDEPEKWTSRYGKTFEEPSRRWYAASVSHMDHGIGRIVDSLDRTGLRKKTLLVFSSDNGGQRSWHSAREYRGRYAEKPHRVLGDNRPWRGWKGDLHEGGIRVPALVNWPGRLSPGNVDAPIHIVDWMPTLCRIAGAPLSPDLELDGRDVWPLISAERSSPGPRVLYWKTPQSSAVLEGDWKLIRAKDGGSVELYDLGADPYETRDLAAENAEKVSSLEELRAELAAKDR